MKTALRITGVVILDSEQSETALRAEVQSTAAMALMKLFPSEQSAIGNVGITVEVDREATESMIGTGVEAEACPIEAEHVENPTQEQLDESRREMNEATKEGARIVDTD